MDFFAVIFVVDLVPRTFCFTSMELSQPNFYLLVFAIFSVYISIVVL